MERSIPLEEKMPQKRQACHAMQGMGGSTNVSPEAEGSQGKAQAMALYYVFLRQGRKGRTG